MTVAGQKTIDLRAATDEQLRTLLDAFIDAFPSELTVPKKVVVEAARRLTEPQHRREAEAGGEAALRQIISDCAAALPNGAAVAPNASIEFMRNLPEEIRLVCARLAASPSSPASGVRVKVDEQVEAVWGALLKRYPAPDYPTVENELTIDKDDLRAALSALGEHP